MKRLCACIALLFLSLAAHAQSRGASQGHSYLGGISATTSGLNSTNKLLGIVPSATISVYLAGTQTLATIYSDAAGDPLANPFTSNAVGGLNPGGWLFFASTTQAYDIVASGGISPNTYPAPVTLCTDCYVSSQFTVNTGVQEIIPGTNINCTPFLSGSCTGNVTVNADVQGALKMQVQNPLPGHQYTVIYPTTSVTSSFGVATVAGSPTSTFITNGPTGCFGLGTCHGQNIVSGFSYPAGLTASQVTSIYTFSVAANTSLGGLIAISDVTCTDGSGHTTGTPGASSNAYSLQQFSGLATSWDPAQIANFSCQIEATAGETANSSFNVPAIGLIVFYTGSPVATNNAINVVPPLYLNTATNNFGIDLTWPFPGKNLLGQAIANLPTAPTTGAMYLVTNGASSTDCTTGGGSNLVGCYWNGSSYTAFSGGGSGTVNSVAMTMPGAIFNTAVPGSPITTSGTFAPTLLTQTANTVLAGPATGSAATPTFRAMVPSDLPVATSSTFGAVKPDNSTVTISGGVLSATGGGVQYNPSNTKYFFYGTSQYIVASPVGVTIANGCQNAGQTQLSISSGSVSGGVGTFTYTTSLAAVEAGEKLTLENFGTSSLNQDISVISTTGTVLTANISGGFSGSTGTGIAECTYSIPIQASRQPFFKTGTTFNYSGSNFTLANAASTYTTFPTTGTSLHALSPVQSGNTPEYLMVNLGWQDISNGSSAATVEAALLTAWGTYHTDGYIVVETALPNSLFTGSTAVTGPEVVSAVNQWLVGQKCQSNSTSGQCWDEWVSTSQIAPDSSDTERYITGNNVHFTEATTQSYAAAYNEGLTTQSSLPTATWGGVTPYNINVINSNTPGYSATEPTNGGNVRWSVFTSGSTDFPFAQFNNLNVVSFQALTGGHAFNVPSDTCYSFNSVPAGTNSFSITTAADSTVCRDPTLGPGWFTFGLGGAQGNTLGGVHLTGTLGPATAPSGSCTIAGEFELTMDGNITRCLSGTWTAFSGGSGITALTGDVTASGSGSVAATLATVNSSPGSCGDSTHVCQVTTNGKGLVTAQSAVAISGGGGASPGASIFNITSQTTDTGTSATSMLGGAQTIPAGNLIATTPININAGGIYTIPTAYTGTVTIAAFVDGTQVATTGAFSVPSTAVTNGTWSVQCQITTYTTGASGTYAFGCPVLLLPTSTATITLNGGSLAISGTTTVDTTISHTFDLKWTWSTSTGSPSVTGQWGTALVGGAPVTSVNGQTGAVTIANGGTVTYTSSQTASSSDNGLLVVMNCSSACAYTLPSTQPSSTWSARVTSQGSTVATIALGGSDTFNGSASVPLLNSYRIFAVWANSAVSTDYRGDAPLVAGSGVNFTPASNGFSVASSGGASGFPFTIIQESTQIFANATSFTFTFPQALQSSGATAFLIIAAGGTTAPSTPTGWTADFSSGNGTSNVAVYVFHLASGSQTSASWTSSTASMTAYLVELSGTRSIGTSSTNTSASAGVNVIPPSITPASGAAVFTVIGHNTFNTSSVNGIASSINPLWKVFGMQNVTASGDRSLEGRVYASSGTGAALQPPVFSGLAAFANSSWATFSIQ